MATALVTANRVEGRPLGRRAARRRDTPSWLRSTGALLAGLAIIAAASSSVAVLGRQSATSAARSRVEPLLIDAQTVITSLSDADTTAAGSFLAGRVVPAGAAARYSDDLAQAAAGGAAASRQASAGGDVRNAEVLAVGLPIYSGLVQTAVADQRQGLPVAASYLGEASTSLRASLLPAALSIYHSAQRRLDADRAAVSRLPVIVAVIVVWAALLVGSVWLQVQLARRFRRILSLPALAATAAVAAALVWSGAALGAQGNHVRHASQQGSGPLSRYTQARILTLQARADDELTLVTRDSVPSYQNDFAVVAPQVDRLLASTGTTTAENATLTSARRAWNAYQRVHASIRAADSTGNTERALALASGPNAGELPAVAGTLAASLVGGVGAAQDSFGRDLAAAAGDVGGLAAGVAVLSLLAGALVLLSVQRRLAEYR